MEGLKILFQFIWKMFTEYRRFVPVWFASTFVLITFLVNVFNYDIIYAVKELANALFAAELVIHQNVSLAVSNSPDYTLWSFLAIWNSIIVIYFFIKWMTILFTKVTGSTAEFGSAILSLGIFAILEISVIKFTGGKFDFIPIWDGIIFLLMNLKPVFANISFVQWIIETMKGAADSAVTINNETITGLNQS